MKNISYIREVKVNYKSTKKEKIRIYVSKDVHTFLNSVLYDNSREHFIALFLDGSHNIAAYSVVAIGSANACQIHPREIFQRAVLCGAVSFIIAHNHPSSSLTPSEADISLTKRISECASLLGINFIDSLIFTAEEVFSMSDNMMPPFYRG